MLEWLTEAKIVQSFDSRLHVIKKRGYVREETSCKWQNHCFVIVGVEAFFFLKLLLFRETCIGADHMSENNL